MIAAIAALLVGAQDGEVDRILSRFAQRQPRVENEEQYLRLVEDTRTELERYARENPRARDAPRAAFHAAEMFLRARDPRSGEARLRRLLEEHPDCDQAPSARFLRGEILLELEQEAAARAAFEEFARLHPRDERVPAARIYAASTLRNERRYDEAAEALLAARREFADRKEAWDIMLQLAIVRHVQERHDEARRALEQVIRECPDERPRELARRHLTEYLNVGRPAPAGRVRDLQGSEFSLEDHRGKVVVVYFFDSAAPEAVAEADSLRRAWEQFKGRDLRLLGVSVGRDRGRLEAFRDVTRIGWTIFVEGKGLDGDIARLFNVRGLPWLLAVDRQGRTRFFSIARRDLRNALEKLLEEK